MPRPAVDKAVEQHLATRGDEKLSTAQVGERIAASLLAGSIVVDVSAERVLVAEDLH